MALINMPKAQRPAASKERKKEKINIIGENRFKIIFLLVSLEKRNK